MGFPGRSGRKSWWEVLALLLAAAWLMGLGNGNDKGESSHPIPQRNFTVRLTEAKGLTMDAIRLTWEGKAFLRALYGSAPIPLPLEKLQSIKVLPEKRPPSPTWSRRRSN